MKKKKARTTAPTRFSAQLSLKIPSILLKEKNAYLIPIYYLLQGLALREGFASAGDKYLAEQLSSEEKKLSDRTVRRRIEALESLGLIYRENPNQNRRLYPWHKYADKIEASGDLDKAAKITAQALGKRLAAQMSLEFEEPQEIGVLPSDEMIGERIRSKYPTDSFFGLGPALQETAVSEFSLESVADLCWLFRTNISGAIWDNWKKLKPEDRKAVEFHAPRLVNGRKDRPRYIPKLENYLDPRRRSWLEAIPADGPKTGKGSKKGVSPTEVNAAAEDALTAYFNQ